MKDYLPGCYRNLEVLPDESLPGFLLRLAEGNGYPGITQLLGAAGLELRGPIHEKISEVRTSSEMLGRLGRMAHGDSGHLVQLFYAAPLGDAVAMRGLRVDLDALLAEASPCCPKCLRERGIFREDWELSAVTVCARHACLLVDCCPQCRTRISWRRPRLHFCAMCGFDLRDVPTEPAGPSETEASEDFAALAPFRFQHLGGEPKATPWDTAFRLFKAIALPQLSWAKLAWPKRACRDMDIGARHAAIQTLASTKTGQSYVLSKLQCFAGSRLPSLKVVPRSETLFRYCKRLVVTEGGLPGEFAVTLSCSEPPGERLAGIDVYGHAPPSLSDATNVMAFMGVDRLTFSGLSANGLLKPPGREEFGFDIDVVLASQRFLIEELLYPYELRGVVGIPLDWSVLRESTQLVRWNDKNPSDPRIALDTVAGIQLELLAATLRASPPETPVRLGDYVRGNSDAFKRLHVIVDAILAGTVSRLAWGSPYDWANLRMNLHDAQSICPGGT